jgi:hypothetical protein
MISMHRRTRAVTRALRRGSFTVLATLAVVTALSCRDALKVEDPQTFSNTDLDNPLILPSVANGVEGQFQQVFDDVVVSTALLSDEVINSSTWIDWADISTGRLRGDWATTGMTWAAAQDEMLRTRFSAQDAARRITRVLGATEANKSKLMAQVMDYEAWADLILGMAYCESPLVPGGPRAPDTELYKQAVTKFTAAITVAQASGDAGWVNFAIAGRARANLLAGNYDAALADAQAVPAAFIKQAIYSVNSSTSNPGNQFHYNRNRSAGLHKNYWSLVDTTNNNVASPIQYVKDPWTNLEDQRMAVSHPRGRLGVDNTTLHYGIVKYANYEGPITITSKREMNLIEAEVYWRKGDFANAIAKLNLNRTTAPAPLPAFVAAGLTSTDVRDRILSERFAELFVEGHRMTDLDRFNLVATKLGTGRAKKLPLSRNEILNNVSMKQGQAACPGIS